VADTDRENLAGSTIVDLAIPTVLQQKEEKTQNLTR
jgi:hypothetical protein